MKDALILNALVLLVVLEAYIGQHRKIGWFRILRPFVTSVVAVAIFVKAVTTTGTGLTLELALAAAGIVIGLAATALMTVYRSPRTHKPVSRAGFGYALLWIVVIGARTAFSYGSAHWFGAQLDRWMTQHAVTTGALTDALLDREHVTLHMRQHPRLFRPIHVVAPPELHWPELSVTLDERGDFELIRHIVEHLGPTNPLFGCRYIVTLLRANPAWLELNSNVTRKGDS